MGRPRGGCCGVFLIFDTAPLCERRGVAGWNTYQTRVVRGETGFDTLLGPEKTSGRWWVFFLAMSGLDRLTHPLCEPVWLGGCGGGCGGFGVWWCVECCIVDASILLCLVLWFECFVLW